jgi:uncharacterized protein YjbJ (UPF0337 family)
MGAIADRIKGKAKQMVGKLTGDKTQTARGTARKAKGDISGAMARGVRKTKGAARRIARRTKK